MSNKRVCRLLVSAAVCRATGCGVVVGARHARLDESLQVAVCSASSSARLIASTRRLATAAAVMMTVMRMWMMMMLLLLTVSIATRRTRVLLTSGRVGALTRIEMMRRHGASVVEITAVLYNYLLVRIGERAIQTIAHVVSVCRSAAAYNMCVYDASDESPNFPKKQQQQQQDETKKTEEA